MQPAAFRLSSGEAFSAMDTTDIVTSPATDGGYYLLGMKQLRTELFSLKPWSTMRCVCTTAEIIKDSAPLLHNVENPAYVDEEKNVHKGS